MPIPIIAAEAASMLGRAALGALVAKGVEAVGQHLPEGMTFQPSAPDRPGGVPSGGTLTYAGKMSSGGSSLVELQFQDYKLKNVMVNADMDPSADSQIASVPYSAVREALPPSTSGEDRRTIAASMRAAADRLRTMADSIERGF